MNKRSCSDNTTVGRLRAVKPKNDATVTASAEYTATIDDSTALSTTVFIQEDIVATFLSFLDLSDIRCCSEVSKTCWKAIARLEELTIHAVACLDGHERMTKGIEYMMHLAARLFSKRRNSLRRVSIFCDYDDGQSCWTAAADESLGLLLSSCSLLTHFRFKGSVRCQMPAALLRFDTLKNLETLVIDFVNWNSSLDLTLMLSRKTNLRVLEITNLTKEYYPGWEMGGQCDEVSTLIGSLHRLQKLVITCSDDFERILDGRMIFTSLRQLEELVVGEDLIDDSVLHVISQHCLNLRQLKMYGVRGFISLLGLKNVLNKCPIHALSIPFYRGEGKGVCAVTELCQAGNNLRILEIFDGICDKSFPSYRSMEEDKRRLLLESAAFEASAGHVSLVFYDGYVPTTPVYT